MAFADLKEKAKRFDTQHALLKQQLNGGCKLEAAITLDRILKDVLSLEGEMTTHLSDLKKHNRQMEKTLDLVKITVKQKQIVLDKITSKINEYTLGDDDQEVSITEVKSTSQPQVRVETTPASKQSSGPPPAELETPKHSLTQSAPATPVRSETKAVEICTPKLTDYLSLDNMYSILNKENLITKSSKRSSAKKKSSQTPVTDSLASRRSLWQTNTPGNVSSLTTAPEISTPTMPQLIKVEPLTRRMPAPLFSDRMAMIDAESYHCEVEEKLRKLISLDLINKVIHSVDLLFKLNPNEPVEKEHIYKVITPLAGLKTKLCVSIMMKLNRLKTVSGDLMLPVHGRPT